VHAFRERPLEGRYPSLFVDAKVEEVRDSGRVARKCVVIAHAVHETGRREIIGLDVGEAETEAFWREFLQSLVARGVDRRAAGHQRRAPRPPGGAGTDARRAVAALHGALPARPMRA
jgi:Transposase, Mutator family